MLHQSGSGNERLRFRLYPHPHSGRPGSNCLFSPVVVYAVLQSFRNRSWSQFRSLSLKFPDFLSCSDFCPSSPGPKTVRPCLTATEHKTKQNKNLSPRDSTVRLLDSLALRYMCFSLGVGSCIIFRTVFEDYQVLTFSKRVHVSQRKVLPIRVRKVPSVYLPTGICVCLCLS